MMDNDVEARLREALRLHAAESPAGATMLSAVRTIAVRRRRRRHTTWAAAVAVLFVLSAAAVPGILRRPEPFATPRPTVHSVLTSGTPITVEFPYTLPGATVVLAAGRPTLRDKGFEVWTTTVAPTAVAPTPVTVRKKAGAFVETDRTMLYWSETPGEWLVVATSPGNRADLLKVATALTSAPSTGAVPFTFSLMPDGYTVDNVEASVVTFSPPGVAPSEGFLGKVAVMLDATPEATTAEPGDHVVVPDGRKALLSRSSGAVTLSIPAGGGRTLVVQDTMAVHLSQQDLLDFAGGIEVTSSAVAGNG